MNPGVIFPFSFLFLGYVNRKRDGEVDTEEMTYKKRWVMKERKYVYIQRRESGRE